MSKTTGRWIFRILLIGTLLGSLVAAYFAGSSLASPIIIPAWLVGSVVGVLVFIVLGTFSVFFSNTVDDVLIPSPYQSLFKNVFAGFWWVGLIPATPVLLVAWWLVGWGWSIPMGLLAYVLGFFFFYLGHHMALFRSITSATFVADTYRSAGYPIVR